MVSVTEVSNIKIDRKDRDKDKDNNRDKDRGKIIDNR